MRNKLIIAIDGFSSCGKSTLAKQLAKALHYVYIDTGAMYRAVTLFFTRNNVNINHENEVKKALSSISIAFERDSDGALITILNGENVENEIRGIEISNKVSEVSTISDVRKLLVEQQQKMGEKGGIVMDGRDIGTVVFPNADLKIFVTADSEIRTDRRFEEMKHKGSAVDRNEIKQNLLSRDYIDSTRADSPLKQADDAIVLDNSFLSKEEQLARVLGWVNEIINQKIN